MRLTIRTLSQLKPDEALIRSWSVAHPTFYGERTSEAFVDSLLETELRLLEGTDSFLDPRLCRVLAAYHGPKGAKVPLSVNTISGCVRPAFIDVNPDMKPSALSCYGGGCYLYHARAVPAKKDHEFQVRAHTTPKDELISAARLSKHFGLPIRDNQSSDGSLSIALPVKKEADSQLLKNLRVLAANGLEEVPYLCFSSAYVEVTDSSLHALGEFDNLVLHVTVSGWHSREENILRLGEFSRYAERVRQSFLRVVNRQDWASGAPDDGSANCEEWLLDEIRRRGLNSRVIRTPFHSVHPFPGSRTGKLGSRHLAGIEYSSTWPAMITEGAGECCSTGKCKSCPTACGTRVSHRLTRKPLVASRAFQMMLRWELQRQEAEGISPLGTYTARMLTRKAMEQAEVAGAPIGELTDMYKKWDHECGRFDLNPLQRKRLVNDSHALVVDGLDRHRLWANLPQGEWKEGHAS